MPASVSRRPSGPANGRFKIKSSHSSRMRLAVSHRAGGQAWSPPRKDDAPVRDPKRGR